MPAAITPETVAAASLTESNQASRVLTSGALAVSLTSALVTIARVPSDPTSMPRRSSPISSGAAEPTMITEPSASTTSSASTWLTVEPSARQWGPPELLATFPPIVQAACDEGSGAKCRPSVGGRPGQVEVDDTRAHPGRPVDGVDFVDSVHAGGGENDATVERHRSRRQTGSGSAGDDRDAVAVGDAHHGLDFSGGRSEPRPPSGSPR